MNKNSTKLWDSCTIHYNLLIPSFYRYIGGYMGDYLKVDKTLETLENYGCSINTMQEVQLVMSVACPKYLVAEDSRSNFFFDYLHNGNHTTIAQNVTKVM